MKKLFIFAVLAVLTVILTACGSKEKDSAASASNGKFALKYNGEASVVNAAELAEDLGYFKKVTLDYKGFSKGGPESIQYVATKQIDFGSAFNAAIIKSVEKGVKIKSVITSYGSTNESYLGFFRKKGSPITEAKDLIGKKVSVNIRGAHLEMALQKYLLNAGLTDEEIAQVEFVTLPSVNAEQTLLNDQIDLAGLTFIYRDKALEANKTTVLFKDIDKEVFDGEYNAGGYFFSEDFIKEHPEEVKDFTQGVAKAFEWLKTTEKDEVIARMTKIMEARKREESPENLKYWHDAGIVTEGGVIEETDYDRFLEQLVKSGELDSKDIDVTKYFTNEFNPYN
ncbi:MAG: ABC transporter substrate-binding protein [Kurthia sp.]|nr:ABC transporter substrate-binding protein [Candidatus Kurthia equi]